MATDTKTPKETALEAENAGLRELLDQAGIDAARLLAKAGIDASANEAAKRLQHLLLEELHHRVKNTLATIGAITSQSLRTAASLEQGRTAVEARLAALGRAHDLLLQAKWSPAKLIDVVRSAIAPFEGRDRRRFDVRGPPVEIGPGAVLPLTMSLNELCTNAVKYGALSNAVGHIEIAWTASEETLGLTWIERDGPVVSEPSRRSFGSRLIGRLTEQMHGDVSMTYASTGLVYRLDVPLSAVREARGS